MSSSAETDEPEHVNLVQLGGLAGVLGGLAWTVKGTAILVGWDQPPLLFEVAPAFFAVGLASVAYSTMAVTRRRRAVIGLAAVSVLTGLAAILSDLVGDLVGAALAVSSLALTFGLVTLERHRRWPAPLAWWIGIAMVPALLLGGALSMIDERFLEIPVVGLGLAWVVVGQAQIHHRWVNADTPPRLISRVAASRADRGMCGRPLASTS